MVQAFVLIQTDVGRSSDVRAAMGEIDGVVEVKEVTGPYDVVARVEASSMDHLGRLVLSQVQKVEGITRTLTCPVVEA